MTWKQRYEQAHRKRQAEYAPSVVNDFGHLPTKYPDVTRSNGLTRAIINYLNWTGSNATRITSAGRQIQTKGGARWIPGTTRRGRADIDSTILINGVGRPVKWEIKCGDDVPSEYQLAEQAKEHKAGGYYFFTHSMDEFFQQYDSLFVGK